MNVALWIVQILLALAYLGFGGMKLMLPAEQLAAGSPVPVTFMRFIGVCEVLGAFGLILPWMLGIRPMLTPLAAVGLTIVMVGAVVITVMTMGVMPALLPLVLGLLDAFVAWGRWSALTTVATSDAGELAAAR
ncbi:MAG: DoxX family protein [Chloroflexota bacterium]